MPFFDLPMEELIRYQPDAPEPADFDAFWANTLEETRHHPLDARFVPVDFGLRTLDIYDVTFAGYGGQPIKGWLMLPKGTVSPLPGVVEFIGYGGGRAFPFNWLTWPSTGYAYLVMDTRGQGSSSLRGDTPDLPDGANPAYPGFMTQGILDPRHYYYRRLFTDAVRAVEALQQHPMVDRERIAATGVSQGGGITLAVSGLMPSIKVAMPDVPFLCHFRRAVQITPEGPYTEIVTYLRAHRDKTERVLQTLNYFDGIHFARRIQARVFCSTALMDTICPPSTVYAAYNALRVEKEMRVYPYNDHAGGGIDHTLAKVNFLQALWPT